MACAAAKASEASSVRADAPFLNALAFVELYGLERVKGALCVSHGEHFRAYRSVAEQRAKNADS
jgi:hypothetical protein